MDQVKKNAVQELCSNFILSYCLSQLMQNVFGTGEALMRES